MLMKLPRPEFLQHPLAREITLAVVVKLVVIAALFYAFFNGRTVHTDPDAVARRLADPQQQLSN
jgi:hypothetical protein